MPGKVYALLNRDLFHEFSTLLSEAEWDIALLQEVPPRWAAHLAGATGSWYRATLTSRNWMRPIMGPVARIRPQLVGSWEGGCNLILVRGGNPGTRVEEHEQATLRLWPERRAVSMVRAKSGLCVANLHASTGDRAAGDVLRAARLATDRAGDAPLVLGGDFNLRPATSSVFEDLERQYGLSGNSGPRAIDHLLLRGAESLEPAETWPDIQRDLPDPETGLRIRLSDHAPVTSRISA